jgi:hypothetical protein
MGQLPLQQRGHRTVARSAAEQLGVPAFGRGEIGGKQRGVGLLEVHALLRAGHARSIRQCGVDGIRRGRIVSVSLIKGTLAEAISEVFWHEREGVRTRGIATDVAAFSYDAESARRSTPGQIVESDSRQ